MKRGTPDHPKVELMMHGLGIPKYAVAGILELLWHYTARYTPRGDIGKWTDSHIEAAVGWDGAAGRLVEVLHDCGWIDDEVPGCRWYVHDWHEHADDAVHRVLARARLRFANGAVPHVSGLGKDERPAAILFYSKRERRGKNVGTSAPRSDHVAPTPGGTKPPAVAVPGLAKPEPKPVPVPEPLAPPPTTLGHRDGLEREGYALAGEEAKARGKDIQEVLREASTIPQSGWYLLSLEGAKPEHLMRTVIRLRDNAKARGAAARKAAGPTTPAHPTISAEDAYARRRAEHDARTGGRGPAGPSGAGAVDGVRGGEGDATPRKGAPEDPSDTPRAV